MSENRCNIKINKITLGALVHGKESDEFSIGIGLNDTFQFNGANFTPSKNAKIEEIWSLPYKSATDSKFFIGVMKSGKVIGKSPLDISKLSKNITNKIKLKVRSSKGIKIAKVKISIILEEDGAKLPAT